MWFSVFGVAYICTFVGALQKYNLSEEESVTTLSNIFIDGMTTVPTGGYVGSEVTTEADPLYLEWDYEYLSRQEFWNMNKYECQNGSMVPSSYLRKKYGECKRIHRTTPLCTKNCEMAITMLLGEKRIPTIELFSDFFAVVLPEKLWNPAIRHYRKCFDKFGRNDSHFLDSNCGGPQNFFTCTKEFDTHMVC